MGIPGLTGKRATVLLVRDTDILAETLRQALLDASPEERPGLERAAALVASTATTSEPALRARWTRARWSAVGFDGDITSVAAVKALRQAEPSLSLLAAVELQRDAVAHPE
ncbi:hypothetical protein ACYBSK_02235 [Streptomyces sp. BYX5S]